MKILYVLHSTLEFGGATKSFLLMLKGVMNHGVNPIVVVPDANGVAITLKNMGIRVVVVPFRMNVYPPTDGVSDCLLFVPRLVGRLVVNSLAVKKLRRLLKDEHVDIIHSNSSVIDIGVRLAQSLHVPHIYHIREYGDKDFGFHQFPCRKRYLSLLQRDYIWSIFITKSLKTYYGMDGNPRSSMIYNPIYPIGYTTNHGNNKSCLTENTIKKPYFLYAGRLEEGKGVFDLIKAYIMYIHEVSEPLPLYIAGSTGGDGKDIMAAMVRDANIGHLVTFLGNRDDIASLMQEAKAIVIPSYHEAFGRCLTEAMFNGCLTIGRDTSGTREQYDNGKELMGRDIGMRFNSIEGLAACMKEVTSMPKEQISQMTDDARHVVSILYSIENNVKEVLNLYNRIKYNQVTVLS